MDISQERLRILDMIDSGRITAEQGMSLLQALNNGNDAEPEPLDEGDGEAAAEEASGGLIERSARMKRMWIYPLWAGLVVAAGGAALLGAALLRTPGEIGLLFACASVPLALGLFVALLAWMSRSAAWLHLRVRQAPGKSPQRIALSFPLPARSGAWFVRTFGRYIPALRDRSVEDLLYMVEQTAVTGAPIYIQANEGEEGEKVEIFIG